VPVVVRFELFVYSDPSKNVISKGVSEPRVYVSGRAALRDLLCLSAKQKVPRPYSGAEDDAPSLTGTRDDDLFDKEVIALSLRFNLCHDRNVTGVL
jgi:hypothetical protein